MKQFSLILLLLLAICFQSFGLNPPPIISNTEKVVDVLETKATDIDPKNHVKIEQLFISQNKKSIPNSLLKPIMKKTRINLSERFPLYHAASNQAEKFAELSDAQTETLTSIETHLTELQDEITKLKEDGSEEEDTSASEDEKDKTASEEEDKKTASEDEDEKKASEDDDEYMKAAASNERFAALEAQITSLESLLNNKPSSASTVIGANITSEGEGEGKKTYATSVDDQLSNFRKK